ncbi:MAG TPA: AAA family ATPase [Ardenticatenaceae bacterium]|jgi:DNA-binding SARP family transcriptional activator/tetratricopeptide (TPR) repeat protein
MSGIHLYLLGVPRFTRDGVAADLTVGKAVALLAYLAVTQTPQSRERLLDLLWPDSAPDAARKNLRNALWAIRRALGEEVLQSHNEHLSLGEGVWVDVHAFEYAARSLSPVTGDFEALEAMYRGPLLDGLNLSDSAEWELWLVTERQQLEQAYLRALESLVGLYRERGAWNKVIAVARRALAHDNLQEPMYRALIEAHARLGERPEALRQYETLQMVLERELGVEPLPETEALRAAILEGEVQPDLTPKREVTPRPRRHATHVETPRIPFIGREQERQALDDALQQAREGQFRVVLLTGEAGIGKSRLWHEWATTLPRTAIVLEGHSLDATQGLPFAPLVELFGDRAVAEQLFTPGSPVPPIWLAEVARLLPDLRVRLPNLPAPAVLPPEEERRRVFEAFARCLDALDGQPLVLFLDDLHWADRATLDWLGYLTHRLRERALLLVGTYRSEEASGSLARLVATWAREGVAQRLTLPHLTREEALALLLALGGDAALADRVQGQSGGNPYFLIEICRSGPGEVPPALAELVRARIARLPEAAQQVLQAAAVLEPDLDFGTLRRTSGRSEEELVDALDALLDASVLVERDEGYAFVHPLVADAVQEALSGTRTAFLHRRAAEALEATHAGRLPPVAGRLAAHYAAGSQTARAAHFAQMAGDHALTLAAPAEAIAFYRQALALEPTPERQLRLGKALIRQGDLDEAKKMFEAAVVGFEAQGDSGGIAQAALSLADAYLPSGRADEVNRWARKSLSYLEGERDPASQALANFLLGAISVANERGLDEAEQYLSNAARLAEENGLWELAARCRFMLGNLLAIRGDLKAANLSFLASIPLAQRAGDQYQEVLGHNNAAYHLLLGGNLALAREHIETAIKLAEERALAIPFIWLYSTQGEIALGEQQWDEAERWFRRGLAEAEAQGNTVQVANYHANLGLAAQGRGDLDGALMKLEMAYEMASALSVPVLQPQVTLWLAELHLKRSERAAAEEALMKAEARLAGGDLGRLQAQAWHLRERLAASTPN